MVVVEGLKKLRAELLVASSLFLSSFCLAQTQPAFKLLHSFGGSGDGISPSSSVTFDSNGNLYGTTQAGGALGYGTVYELSPQKDGTWSETILHSFPNPCCTHDGSEPSGGVAIDGAGNLYGTATSGGLNSRGVIFELTPGQGVWTENILYNFCSLGGCADGGLPFTAPILDSAGNLYGSANGDGDGVIYELARSASEWEETVLHSFCSQPPNCPYGDNPGQIIMDRWGNIYGPAEGGTQGGVVFVLRTPKVQGGEWTEQVLHDLVNTDGAEPNGVVLYRGALYGTAADGGGGQCGCGTIFELTPAADVTAGANYTVLYRFMNFNSGEVPVGVPVFDKAGNMYGTASFGGAACGCGLVWELKPVVGGWQYEILHKFTGPDGIQPAATLTIDSEGNLYGTTIGGGNGGVVFEILNASPTAK